MQKCSLIEHKEIDSSSFCSDCKIYMCHKCEKLHTELFRNHHEFKLDKDKNISEIFTGLCEEKNHSNELEYYCYTHNKLCCARCITKIKTKENGQHTDCKVCAIEDIENDKKNKLKDNIKYLEDLSINLDQSINELKNIYEKINKNKEQLKINIQKLFTKIRNELNEREYLLLLDVDKQSEIFLDEYIIKES